MTGHEGYIEFNGIVLPVVNWSLVQDYLYPELAKGVRDDLHECFSHVRMSGNYTPVFSGRPLKWWYKMLAETPRG